MWKIFVRTVFLPLLRGGGRVNINPVDEKVVGSAQRVTRRFPWNQQVSTLVSGFIKGLWVERLGKTKAREAVDAKERNEDIKVTTCLRCEPYIFKKGLYNDVRVHAALK